MSPPSNKPQSHDEHRATLRSSLRSSWLCGLFVLAVFPVPSLIAADSRVADAVEKNDRAAIRALVKQHAEVDGSQTDGMTALHWAAYLDDAETAKLLLKAGANAKGTNSYGVTPLSLACQNGNAAIVELLLAAGADPNTKLRGGET